jgi:hypothetical protein
VFFDASEAVSWARQESTMESYCLASARANHWTSPG